MSSIPRYPDTATINNRDDEARLRTGGTPQTPRVCHKYHLSTH